MKTCYYTGVLDPINRKKPQGMINGLQKLGYTVSVFQDQHQIRCEKNYDLFFGEFLNLNSTLLWGKYKTVVIWSNVNIKNIIDCAIKHPNTKFIIAPKSYLHDPESLDIHIKKYSEIYNPTCKFEFQNLNFLKEIFSKSEEINLHCFKVLNNLFYIYLPCCLSEDNHIENIKNIDILYIGTTHNRPHVKAAIEKFKSKFNIYSTFTHGPTTPEQTVELYSKSKIVLTEQVLPVLLEYPVRLGEASRQGCHVVAYSPIHIPQNMDLIPPHTQKNNFEEFVCSIENNILNFKSKFINNNSYVNAIKFLLDTVNE